MASFLQSVREKLDQVSASVVLVPGSCFFVRDVEVPGELPEKEIAGFAELTLESLAPFPIDQLAWGYWRDGASSRLLLYAAYRERIRALGFEDLEKAAQVLPSFVLGAVRETPERATVRLVQEGSCLSALFYAAGERIPHAVRSRDIPEGVDPESVKQKLLARAPVEGVEEDPEILVGGLHRLLADQTVEFTLYRREALAVPAATDVPEAREPEESSNPEDDARPIEAAPMESNEEEVALPFDREPDDHFSLSETGLDPWAADIRESKLLKKRRQDRNLAGRLWWVYVGAAAAAVLMLVGEIFHVGQSIWLAQLQGKIEDRRPHVAEIEKDFELLVRLQQTESEALKPFEMLAVLNSVRPRQVYFTEVRAADDAPNAIRIEGLATNSLQANSFAETIIGLPIVQEAPIDVSSSVKGANFTLDVAFQPDSLELEKPEEPEEVLPETESTEGAVAQASS